jgi:hypothetical protein
MNDPYYYQVQRTYDNGFSSHQETLQSRIDDLYLLLIKLLDKESRLGLKIQHLLELHCGMLELSDDVAQYLYE